MRKLVGSLVMFFILFVLFQAIAAPDPKDLAGVTVQTRTDEDRNFPYAVYSWRTPAVVPDEFINWELTDEPRYHGLNQATLTLHPELQDNGTFCVRELVGYSLSGRFNHMEFRPSVERTFVLGPTGTVLVYEVGGPAQELAEQLIYSRMFGRSVEGLPEINSGGLRIVMIANHDGGVFLYKRRLMGELATAAMVTTHDQVNTFFRQIPYPAVEDDIVETAPSESAMTQR